MLMTLSKNRTIQALVVLFSCLLLTYLGILSKPDLTLAGLAFAGIGDIVELKAVTESIDKLGRLHEEYKQSVDQQFIELKKGIKDPLLEEKIAKMDEALTTLQEQKDNLEKRLNRPSFGLGAESGDEEKNLISFNHQRKASAISSGRPQPADVDIEEYRDYKKAFSGFMRKNSEQWGDLERKAMSIGSDADGGYLVPADTTGRIVSRLFELSPIRAIASVQNISSDALEGIEDLNEADAGWTAETVTRPDTNTPQVGKWRIPVEEMYAQPKATQKLLDDASVDIEQWLTGKVANKLARLEGAAFIVGNGINKPRGFATYETLATADATRACGKLQNIATGVNGDFAATTPADILFDLQMAFKPNYLNNANWVTKRAVLAKIRKFKEATTNGYLWQPGLAVGQPQTLLGHGIVMAEDMPTLATDSLSLALGDFRGYQIVDRLGIRVLRDPYTDKPYVKFYTTKRTGGAVLDFDAIKFVKFGS